MKILEQIHTPEEFFEFLKHNMNYGVVDKSGRKWTNCSSEKINKIITSDWRLKSPEEILSSEVGHCYDFTELERFWFEHHGFKVKTFWICAYQKGVENSGFAHSFLAFKQGGMWIHFEVSDAQNQGLHKFSTLKILKDSAKANQIAYATSQTPTATKFSVILNEFSAPPLGLNLFEYVDFVNTPKNKK